MVVTIRTHLKTHSGEKVNTGGYHKEQTMVGMYHKDQTSFRLLQGTEADQCTARSSPVGLVKDWSTLIKWLDNLISLMEWSLGSTTVLSVTMIQTLTTAMKTPSLRLKVLELPPFPVENEIAVLWGHGLSWTNVLELVLNYFCMITVLKKKGYHNDLHGCLPSFSRTLPKT